MSKFKPYSRRELQRRRKSWAKRNVRLLTLAPVAVLGIAAATSLIIVVVVDGSPRWYLLGLLHAGLILMTLHLLNASFLALDREALWHVRGAWGEENTRSELQRAKRKKVIWGWVDSISLQAGDLDHFVVTREGGLVAIDSKWRNEIRSNEPAEMARAAHKARTRAEGLTRTLLKNERGARHRAKLQSVAVTPVVVLWGAAQWTIPENACIDGVSFVAGRQLLPWLGQLQGDAVSKTAALDAIQRLEQFRETSWQDA